MIVNISEIPQNTSGIYKIEYDNGKSYIGQATNIRNRALEHNSKNRQLCDKKLKKHKAKLVILEQNIPIKFLDEKEKYYISLYDSTNPSKGYNIISGGNVSGKRGADHPNASFSQEQLSEIYDLLINHRELSLIDIANRYGVCQMTIYRIASGDSYIQENLQYPLRKNNHDFRKKYVLDYFSSIDDLLSLKEDLKYRWDLTIEKDLPKKYNLSLRILRQINDGTLYSNYGDYTYPIRSRSIRNNKKFSISDIENILLLLRNTNKTMSEIGLEYNIHRNTVSNINLGKTYPIKNYVYPARKIK